MHAVVPERTVSAWCPSLLSAVAPADRPRCDHRLEEVGISAVECLSDPSFPVEAKDVMFNLLERVRIGTEEIAKVRPLLAKGEHSHVDRRRPRSCFPRSPSAVRSSPRRFKHRMSSLQHKRGRSAPLRTRWWRWTRCAEIGLRTRVAPPL